MNTFRDDQVKLMAVVLVAAAVAWGGVDFVPRVDGPAVFGRACGCVLDHGELG